MLHLFSPPPPPFFLWVPSLTQSKLKSPEDWAFSFVLMFKRFSNAGVYSYCKHFYLQGQVYQHSTQLKSVIIYLRAFECRSVALAANQASARCKATPKNSTTRSSNCWSLQCVYFCILRCGRKRAEWQTFVRFVAAPLMRVPLPARSLVRNACHLCVMHFSPFTCLHA